MMKFAAGIIALTALVAVAEGSINLTSSAFPVSSLFSQDAPILTPGTFRSTVGLHRTMPLSSVTYSTQTTSTSSKSKSKSSDTSTSFTSTVTLFPPGVSSSLLSSVSTDDPFDQTASPPPASGSETSSSSSSTSSYPHADTTASVTLDYPTQPIVFTTDLPMHGPYTVTINRRDIAEGPSPSPTSTFLGSSGATNASASTSTQTNTSTITTSNTTSTAVQTSWSFTPLTNATHRSIWTTVVIPGWSDVTGPATVPSSSSSATNVTITSSSSTSTSSVVTPTTSDPTVNIRLG